MPRLLLALACLVLSSCLDGDEEVWIEKDGSGRIKATYSMPPQFMAELGGAEKLSKRLRDAVESDPNMTLESLGHKFEGGRTVLNFGARFEDFRKLADFGTKHLRDPEQPDTKSTGEILLGTIDIRIEGLTLKYDRTIDLSSLFPENVLRNPGLLGPASFRYTLHMPVAAKEHDAHATSNEGRTLKWTYALRNHTAEPMTTSAKADLPLPWWVWTAGLLSLVLIGALIVWAVRFTASRNRAS